MKKISFYLVFFTFLSSCSKPSKEYPYNYQPDFDDIEEITRTYIYSNSSFTEIDINQQIIDDNL